MPPRKETQPKVRTKLVPTQVAKALAKGGGGIDSGKLLQSLIDCWGGPTQFARDIFAEYQAAKPGSLTRQRILEMATRLTVQVTSQDIARPKAASDMTDDELLASARGLLEKIGGTDTGPA